MGDYVEILNSDAVEFEGEGRVNKKPLKAVKGACDGRDQHISFTLPPLSTVIFKYDYIDEAEYQKQLAKKPGTRAKKAASAPKTASAKKPAAKKVAAKKQEEK